MKTTKLSGMTAKLLKTIPPVALALGLSTAGAETLMMPDREALVSENVVVWGVTDQGGNYTLDCGNGTSFNGPVVDGSYIAHVCNYGAQGTFTATLSSDTDGVVASSDVSVFDGAGLTSEDLRGVRINMAIEDGLRYLWTTQTSRQANFPGSTTTDWGGSWPVSATALATLAFENQGYTLPNDNSAPTGLYEKYIVRRGLNYVVSALGEIAIQSQPSVIAGQPVRDPCVGVGIEASPCTGYRVAYRAWPSSPETFHESYQTGVGILPLAASGALSRVNSEVAGATNGKTYGEILQRMSNALAWGQIDQEFSGDRGGWYYNFNSSSSDGSTIGWAFLAMLDAEAAGAVVPNWVKTELADGGFGNLNNDGSIDYQANGNPASNSSVGPAKAGVGLQGLFLIGELAGVRVDAVKNNIDSWWSGFGGIGGNSWNCQITVPENKGCAYTMYNNFKGLKLHSIQTLPSVGRAAGPGAIPANDWHEDYKDWALANQSAPTTTGGGSWGPVMGFSSQLNDDNMETAIIELILSPVALVLPDPVQFGQFGLQHCLDGPACASRTVNEDTNPAGSDHTVVARAESVQGNPIAGTTIEIEVISGPNAGISTQVVTGASGEIQLTYTSNGTPGTDEIQANIVGVGIVSNVLSKVWAADQICDVDGDGDIDTSDIRAILAGRGQQAQPGDPRDADGDGVISSLDAKICIAEGRK